MKRYEILHRTYYNFSSNVQLNPHTLRLRPRESHELHIESLSLEITPPASLRWHRDVENNSIAIASFTSAANQLSIESKIVIQQFNENPLDFLLDDYAVQYPFTYTAEDSIVLSPYMMPAENGESDELRTWISGIGQSVSPTQTYTLLMDLNDHIHQTLSYRLRDEAGVQTVAETLSRSAGSCRDFAHLFMQAARSMGLAARFVSGYLYTEPSLNNFGSTHAWAEVYLPGAGWTGFDPTVGAIAGADHIAVAVARLAESIPPVAGSFVGLPGTDMNVGVWVTELE